MATDPDPEVPLHRCPVLAKDAARAARALAVPVGQREVWDPSAWPRRHIKLEGHDLLGESEADDGLMRGSMVTALHPKAMMLLRAMARQLSVDHFAKDDCVSTGSAVNLAIRWYVQHPPSPDWALGCLAKWMFDNRRGRPSSGSNVTVEAEAAREGRTIPEMMKRRRDVREARIREALTIMQSRDLTGEEASEGVDLDWVRTGRLVIPKEVAELLNVEKPVDLTPPLPFTDPR